MGSRGVAWAWAQASRGHVLMTPPPQHPRCLLCYHLGSQSYLLPPHLGQESNNVQGQAEAFGS